MRQELRRDFVIKVWAGVEEAAGLKTMPSGVFYLFNFIFIKIKKSMEDSCISADETDEFIEPANSD